MAEHLEPRIVLGLSRSEVGKLLLSARTILGYSLRYLAGQCGISPPQLQRMERGYGEYSVERLTRVCTILGLPIAGVLNWSIRVGAPTPPVPATLRTKLRMVGTLAKEFGLSQDVVFRSIQASISQIQQHLLRALVRSEPPMPFGDTDSHPRFAATMEKAISEISEFGNAARAAALSQLAAEPYQRLSMWGFLAPDVLREVVKPGRCINMPGWPVPQWLAHSLGSGHEMESRGKSGTRCSGKSLHCIGLHQEDSKKSIAMLDNITGSNTVGAVLADQDLLTDLLNRAKRLTSAYGMRSRLAVEIGVKRQAVSQWLSDAAKKTSRPSAENALTLLAWVQEAEGKQKGLHSAVTLKRPTTRKKKVDNEKNKLKSSRQAT